MENEKHKRMEIMVCVRDLLNQLGAPMSAKDLWRHAIDEGMIPEWLLLSASDRGGAEFVRDALKTDVGGLPFAKPVPGAGWKQLALFSYDELSAVLVADHKSVKADLAALNRLAQFCEGKFGHTPDLPLLDNYLDPEPA